MKKFLSLLLVLMLCAMLVPATAETAAAIAVTDMTGREIVLDAPAARVVALTASDVEILYAIGAGDVLVGRGTYCDYPAECLEKPVVNSGADTNIEEILALEPDVVVMATMAQTTEQVAALENAGVKVVVSDAQNIEGVYTAITLLGAITAHETEAEALISEMKATFAEIAARPVNGDRTVYFEVSPLQWGLWTAGQGTFMDELADICGLANAFCDVTGWASISAEQVIDRNPDFIVTTTMYYGEGPLPVDEIKSREGWEDMQAIVNDTVFQADSDQITRPGPRLMEAAKLLADFVAAH